jgi:hypothetical protein
MRNALCLGVVGVATLGFAMSADAFTLIGDEWMEPGMPVPYRFNTVLDEFCITAFEEHDEIRAAFDVWEDLPETRLTFVETAGTTTACGLVVDGFNTMSMEDCLNQCTGGCIAVTSSLSWGGDPTWAGSTELRGKTESDITWTKSFKFGTLADVGAGCTSDACTSGNTFDLRGISIHEIGHFIGLGHSATSAATMFASASACNTSLSSLHPDDIAGAGFVYDPAHEAVALGDLTGGNVKTTLLNAGNIGLSGSGGAVGGQYGSGFEFPLGTQNLYEAALVYGVSGNTVVTSDYRQPAGDPLGQDNDFYQTSGVSVGGDAFSDVVATTTYDDSRAPGAESLGISTQATMRVWTDAANEDFAMVCYAFTNNSGSIITGLRAGMFMDWDFNDVFSTNSVSWDAANQVGIVSDPSTSRVIGVATLNSAGTTTFRALTSADPQTELAKRNYLFDDFNDTSRTAMDINLLIATGDFSMAPGASANASFVMVGGDNLADMLANLATARALYDETEVCGAEVVAVDDAVPGVPALGLSQNYPNPFNPTTTISYDLSRAGMVELVVYDAQGRAVKTLVQGLHPVGTYAVRWDGTNDAGNEVPSGIYFYRITGGGKVESRKMTLLK